MNALLLIKELRAIDTARFSQNQKNLLAHFLKQAEFFTKMKSILLVGKYNAFELTKKKIDSYKRRIAMRERAKGFAEPIFIDFDEHLLRHKNIPALFEKTEFAVLPRTDLQLAWTVDIVKTPGKNLLTDRWLALLGFEKVIKQGWADMDGSRFTFLCTDDGKIPDLNLEIIRGNRQLIIRLRDEFAAT